MNATIKLYAGQLGAAVSDRVQFGRFVQNYIDKLGRLIVAAGNPGELRPIELFGMQVFCMAVFPIFWGIVLNQFGFFSFLFEGPKQVLVYAGFIIGGFMLPVSNIRERAAKRQKTIALQLPDTLDLLTISVEAGLDLNGALRRVVQKHRPGPLKEELERFFGEVEILGKQRSLALRELANRVQLSDLNAVASALIQADRLGVPIGPILRAQSDMLRTRRGQRAEKAAHEAPVKILAPLVMCILPSVFIMILAPIFIKMLTDLHR